MNRIIVLNFFLFLFGFSATAQEEMENSKRLERVKAQKVAYITQQLDLSAEVAQRFWPIYNEREKRKDQKIRSGREKRKDLDSMTEAEAGDLLNQQLDEKEKQLQIDRAYIQELKTVLSNIQIVKLWKAEKSFKKEVLKKFNKRKNKARMKEGTRSRRQ